MPGRPTSSPLIKDLCVKACWRSCSLWTAGRGGGQVVGATVVGRVAGRPMVRAGGGGRVGGLGLEGESAGAWGFVSFSSPDSMEEVSESSLSVSSQARSPVDFMVWRATTKLALSSPRDLWMLDAVEEVERRLERARLKVSKLWEMASNSGEALDVGGVGWEGSLASDLGFFSRYSFYGEVRLEK